MTIPPKLPPGPAHDADLDDGGGSGVAHAEPLCGLSADHGAAGRGAVQAHVAHDDVVLRVEVLRHVLGRVDCELAARQALG